LIPPLKSIIFQDKAIKPELSEVGKILFPATIIEPQIGRLITSKIMMQKIGQFLNSSQNVSKNPKSELLNLKFSFKSGDF